MKSCFLFVFLLALGLTVKAQDVDKGSWYVNLVRSSATAEYKDYLSNNAVKTARIGILGGFLVNAQRKSKTNSPIQLGVELGYMPWGSDAVLSNVGGSFTNDNRSFWINGVARYRPILNASKVNPFIDLFMGPEIVSSNVTEYFDEGSTQKVLGIVKTTRNYGLGAGLGFKRIKENGELRYIDLGLYYQYASKVRTIKRKSASILADGSLSYAETIIKPSTLQIRLGLTGFL